MRSPLNEVPLSHFKGIYSRKYGNLLTKIMLSGFIFCLYDFTLIELLPGVTIEVLQVHLWFMILQGMNLFHETFDPFGGAKATFIAKFINSHHIHIYVTISGRHTLKMPPVKRDYARMEGSV